MLAAIWSLGQKSPTSAVIPQIILIKITSVLNIGVHSKIVNIPKSLDWMHIVPMHLKLFLMVPINVSSHDLQENHFANTKLDYVTATSTYIHSFTTNFS